MSEIRIPIIRAIQKAFGNNELINDNIGIERYKQYYTDDYEDVWEIIEHFRLIFKPEKINYSNGIIEPLSKDLKSTKQGEILTILNDWFKETSTFRKCVGVYFEGNFLHILIRG